MPPPAEDTTLSSLLRQGHYHPAATLAATTLTSTPDLPPSQIFSLFYTRLACLAITGHDAIAAQESLALGDIHSPFYFPKAQYGEEACILPWHLRVLATRFQALAAAEPRREAQGYYDLAAYARGQCKLSVAAHAKGLWKSRLKDLGSRTTNALVAMGDLSGARRLLETFISATEDKEEEKEVLKGWVAMLCLRMGDVEGARKSVDARTRESNNEVLEALFLMAEDRYEEAVSAWRGLLDGKHDVLARHNTAVSLIYTGELAEVTLIAVFLSADDLLTVGCP